LGDRFTGVTLKMIRRIFEGKIAILASFRLADVMSNAGVHGPLQTLLSQTFLSYDTPSVGTLADQPTYTMEFEALGELFDITERKPMRPMG